MKRFFFSLIALAAAAVSCTQSALLETPTLDGTPVSFSPYTGRTPVTKATSIATATELGAEGGFNVYCFLNGDQTNPLLDAELVTQTDGVWSYTNTIYWPTTEGSSLDFWAYSANAKDHLDATPSGFTFTVPDAIDKQVDLLATAYQAGKKANSEGGYVSLTFHHLLSRVGFKVQTNSTKDITIQNISLTGNMPDQGTLSFASPQEGNDDPALVPSAPESKTYSHSNSEAIVGGAMNPTTVPGMEYLMIMPHDAAGHTISITYKIGESTPKTATAELPADFVFAKGKAYEFILKISTSALTFDVTEEEWNETGDTDLQPEIDPVDEFTSQEFGIIYNVERYDSSIQRAYFSLDVDQLYWIDATGKQRDYKGIRIGFAEIVNGVVSSSWTYITFDKVTDSDGRILIPGSTTALEAKYYGDLYSTKDTYVFKKNSSYAFICYPYGLNNRAYADNTYDKTHLLLQNRYYKTFSTSNDFDYRVIEDSYPPVVTIESISVDQNNKSASLSGSFIEGSSPVAKYGFCWMTSAGTPTITNTHYECASSFSHTITGLAEGVNSCRAYVTTKDGNTYYSPVRTIEIVPTVEEGDNTGSGNWGDGSGDSEGDDEIEF